MVPITDNYIQFFSLNSASGSFHGVIFSEIKWKNLSGWYFISNVVETSKLSKESLLVRWSGKIVLWQLQFGHLRKICFSDSISSRSWKKRISSILKVWFVPFKFSSIESSPTVHSWAITLVIKWNWWFGVKVIRLSEVGNDKWTTYGWVDRIFYHGINFLFEHSVVSRETVFYKCIWKQYFKKPFHSLTPIILYYFREMRPSAAKCETFVVFLTPVYSIFNYRECKEERIRPNIFYVIWKRSNEADF